MRPATAAQLGLVGAAVIAAVLLARPERVPAGLTPPPRSATSQQPDRDPAPEAEPTVESNGDEPAEEPVRGRSLTRQELEAGLLKVRARALACRSDGPPPLVIARIVISPAGQVTQVALPPELKGSRAAECITHALRAASFPSWTAPPLPQVEWTYPLRFDGGD
jgi:hypothetical protein